ncbi:tyrosine-type recombinase/integrase [Paraburkholderia sp. BL21I4N1]|uniref:tyrosine-type recombinase/integrase n=1 Tax=Paraburkholderia sp. BL21I4N1 TaxID=1938801 RepID=UPI000CFB8FCC|nr:tyrosine-type recombinase/integrase [Paraburkholderia sp. BL21I4N1]PQV44137.1 site-specific recombinase XerD [Paraburkholderia sp. BL21I4N1]
MKLATVIEAYIVLQQSLGLRSKTARRTLRRFERQMGHVHIADVQSGAVLKFLQGAGPLSSTWRTKYRLLAGLYRYAISRGHVTVSPLPAVLPKFPLQQTPYIYSTSELQRLLDAASVLESAQSQLQAPMFRTLILLLYGSGLRVSEALGLTMRDIDLEQRIITVRDTKFSKTRLVPIGPKLTVALATLADRRRRLNMPDGEDSRFFASRTGALWNYPRVITLFQRVRRVAGIECPPGELRPPRMHDLRHTAAVHRVIAWYRSGQDVQRLLPQLSTYLGHVEISSTQHYLQMTPELLQEASRLFARYAACGGHHD